jgi:Cu/Ag efflux protein CusF
MLQHIKSAVAAGLILVLAGCQGQAGSAGRVYDLKGVVLGVDPASKTLELDHEEIPGFMKAMRMNYTVADAKLLEGLKAGDSVRGTLKVERRSYAITSLEKR